MLQIWWWKELRIATWLFNCAISSASADKVWAIVRVSDKVQVFHLREGCFPILHLSHKITQSHTQCLRNTEQRKHACRLSASFHIAKVDRMQVRSFSQLFLT